MKRNGLEGIEAYHSNNSKDLTDMLVRIAMEENLYLTGGSDYHGPITKPNIKYLGVRMITLKLRGLI